MLKNVSPESVGISSKVVLDFLKRYSAYNFSTHSIIMARGENIFAEMYYAPFHKDFKHRMYSVSKSFVAAAIGICEQEGYISINDKLIKYFPEYEDKIGDNLRETTIRDMLCMSTAVEESTSWFTNGTKNRTEVYFDFTDTRIPGTTYHYDSPGSYMMGVIVEKVTGMPFLEYLKEKALKYSGFSEDSYVLKCPGGNSWADSGVMCTSRDLLIFARFIMDKGYINGVNYLNSEFINEAVKRQVDNDVTENGRHFNTHGYGYQIWKTPNDGFAFIGMGDQFAICDPKTDFVFVINSDNQFTQNSRVLLYHELYNFVIPEFKDESLLEDTKAYNELLEFSSTRKLMALSGEKHTKTQDFINNKTYKLNKNPMNIEFVKFNFEGERGTLTYKNLQGEKKLYFKMCENEFFKFPESNYSDMIGTFPDPGNMYDCACSGAWTEESKLKLKVQIIDKYFGTICMTFGFKDKRVGICMTKNAEAFLEEYHGYANGEIIGG